MKKLPALFLVLFALTACSVQPETPAETLASLEIASQEVDKKIIELVAAGVIKGDVATQVDTAAKSFDAALDTARATQRVGGDMTQPLAAAQAALAAITAILRGVQERER